MLLTAIPMVLSMMSDTSRCSKIFFLTGQVIKLLLLLLKKGKSVKYVACPMPPRKLEHRHEVEITSQVS